MHINHISFILFIGKASAAYQIPSYALFASPLLKYNSAHAKYKTINFGLSARDEEDSYSNLQSKQKELELLEAAMKEAEIRQQKIEDEINQIDVELFDIHKQALEVNAKQIKHGSSGQESTEFPSKPSQQELSSSFSEISSPSVAKEKSFLSSIGIPFVGAGITSIVAAAGFRMMLMSREEKKTESFDSNSTTNRSDSKETLSNMLPSNLGKALHDIDKVEAEALTALKLATEALEKNNVKVVNLKSIELNQTNHSKAPEKDEKVNHNIVLPASTTTTISSNQNLVSIKTKDDTEAASTTSKQPVNEDKILIFDTAPALGRMIDDYLFNMARREFENNKETEYITSSHQSISRDKTNVLPDVESNTQEINLLAIESSSSNPIDDGLQSEKTDVLSFDENASIKKGVMIFDTRVSSSGRFFDNRGKETISSMTDKFFNVAIDEKKIDNTLAKIETELSKQKDTNDVNSMVLVDKSDDVSSSDKTMANNQEDTIISDEIDTEIKPDSLDQGLVTDITKGSSVADSMVGILNPESSPTEVIDLTDDKDELLYPSDIISSYNAAEKSKLQIIAKGTLFRNPKLSLTQSKRPRGGIKLNVLQFFRLRRNPKFEHFTLFGKSSEDTHPAKTKLTLTSLVLLAKVFEQTLKECRD